MSSTNRELHLMVIDCCEHTLAELGQLPSIRLTPISSGEGLLSKHGEHEEEIDLMIIGFAVFPVRRIFISQLRRIYPTVPILILRREEEKNGDSQEQVRGEFVLTDRRNKKDCQVVEALREALPLKPCEHAHKSPNYDVVREVVKLVLEKYSDPDLNLARIARELTISATRLSRILNKQVGVSFRQLLRQTRIEEAKRLLASHDYSVKEVAIRVGFSDSHYFSRSFKQLTGLNASNYRAPQDAVLN